MAAPAIRQVLPAAEVRAELSRILASSEFVGSGQMTNFLHYVVEESLAGREDRLKERTLAWGALGRDSNFDPRHDCIVRVVAIRLRRALERYYAIDGASNPLCIEVPKGSYCPVIRRRCSRATIVGRERARPRVVSLRADRSAASPILAVVPFHSFTGGPKERLLADLLAEDLAVRLSRFSWLELVDSSCVTNGGPGDARAIALRLRADFLLAGTLCREGRRIRMTVRLVNVHSGVMIWADQYDAALEEGHLAHENDIVNRITLSVCGLLGDGGWTASQPAAVGSKPPVGP